MIITNSVPKLNKLDKKEESFNVKKNANVNNQFLFHKNSRERKKLNSCSNYLWFELHEHLKTGEQKKRLSQVYTCKSKFCPFCNWRKSLKWHKVLDAKLEHIRVVERNKFIFLTLTIKNVEIDALSDSTKIMNDAFTKMFRNLIKRDYINGYIKALEVTFKRKDGMAHPHFHVLISVPKNYFSPKNKKYLQKEDWAERWQNALNVDYRPIVDIRTIKAKNKSKSDIKSSLSEVIKYPMKDTDLSNLTPDDLEVVVRQLKAKRLMATGGNLKTSLQKALEELEDEALSPDEWKMIAELYYSHIGDKFELQEYFDKSEKGLYVPKSP